MFGLKAKLEEAQKEQQELKETIENLKAELSAKTKVEIPVECDCHSKLQELVSNEADLRSEILKHEKAVRKAKEELEDTKLKNKIVLEDIKHMQKILDEKNALELDRKTFNAEKTANIEIDKIRKEYAAKLEKELMEERKKMQDFMQRVMDALPNVNVKMKA